MTIGIYCFENIIDGKKYIGQSIDIEYRKSRHLFQLNGNYDGCIGLQHAWSKYGEENFKFYIVEECLIESLDEREIILIKELHSHISENGYNISWGGEAPMRGLKHTEESRKKISENNPNKISENNPMFGKHHTLEAREKISKNSKVQKGENNPLWGKPLSEEHRKKISEGNMGKVCSEETKKKISESNMGKKMPEDAVKRIAESRIGTHASEETKKKMSDSHKGCIPWNKGISTSQEITDKMVLKKIGKKRKGNATSKYVGVSLEKTSGKWFSCIYYKKKMYRLGRFTSEIEAALAYNEKALELYGKDVRLNIIAEDL